MRATYVLHIVAGSVALIAGYLALAAPKGAAWHRRAGMGFVVAMLAMAAGGLAMSLVRGVAPAINVPAALISASMVITGVTTLRPPSPLTRWLDRASTLLFLGVGLSCLVFAAQAILNGGTRFGFPAFPYLLFGVAGTIAGVGDVRLVRSGPPRGAARLARHLWRMSFALFIAALSFFIGQARVIPEPLRIRPLLGLPVLAVLVTMVYWIWRVRYRRSMRGLALGARAGSVPT